MSVCNRSPVAPGPLVDESHGLDAHALPRFMASVDAVIVSLPLTEATRGIVGGEALAAMRPHGVVVNVGRGPVIDEAALFEALSSRRIGGAVIDTWYRYPMAGDETPLPSSLPFHTLDNVLMTPHMSGWTEGTVRRRRQTVADNVNRPARGEALVNLVWPAGQSS